MALQWILTGFATLAGVVAFAAHLRARRLSKRIERLAESYWELRYEQGQLNARIAQLERGGESRTPPGGGAAAFVPLSSLKKM